MKRLVRPLARAPGARTARRRGYTLVELLTATVLTLVLMGALVNIFALLGRSINDSRATLEMTARLRATKTVLQLDFKGLTVPVSPPRHPKENEGYLEILEGNVGAVVPPFMIAVNGETSMEDTTVGDYDDILMFTTRSRSGPYTGRFLNGTIHSNEAEVAWFVRGRTLYRRVLLVSPQVMRPHDGDWTRMRYLDNNYDSPSSHLPDDPTDDNGVVDAEDLRDSTGAVHSFHELYDLSARPDFAISGGAVGWVPNTLGDLTKRENRFAHRLHLTADAFPFNARRWGQLGLPTLRECSDPAWMSWADLSAFPPVRYWDPTSDPPIDFWLNPQPWSAVDRTTGTWTAYPNGSRISEDVILTNVIGFDVKVWDPGAPVFRGVSDEGAAGFGGDRMVSNVLVTQGDPGYELALTHFADEYTSRPTAANSAYLPISFGSYVDLGYATAYAPPLSVTRSSGAVLTIPRSHFSGIGAAVLPRTYDTWSFHYEHDGINQDGDFTPVSSGAPVPLVDEATDGFDNNVAGFDDDGDGTVDEPEGEGNGIVDDVFELETRPPYPVPLRGIQVKIRTFEPDSRQVREVTVVADFSPK